LVSCHFTTRRPKP